VETPSVTVCHKLHSGATQLMTGQVDAIVMCCLYNT